MSERDLLVGLHAWPVENEHGNMEQIDRIEPGTGMTRRAFAAQVDAQRALRYSPFDQIAPLVLALAALVAPFDGSWTERLIVAGALAAVAPLDWIARRYVPADWANFAALAIRLAAGAVAIIAVPILWLAFVVGVPILCVGSIPVETRLRVYLLLALGGGVAVITALVNDVPDWPQPVIVLVVGVVATEIWYREWDHRRRETARRHDAMIDRARMFVWEIDERTGEIVRLTGNVEEVLGYERDELVGTRINEIVVSVEVDGTFGPLDVDTHGRRTQVTLRHRNGGHVALREIRLEPTAPGIVSGVSVDVTELVETSRALRHQAAHDPLTDLANRSRFEAEVTAALDQRENDETVALLMLDLDRFKEINDVLGHATGDHLLVTLAQRLSDELSGVELVARLGGDEFGFLVRGVLTPVEVADLAERIGDVVAQPILVDDLTLAVSASVGVACAPQHGESYEMLLQRADIATYEAKHGGERHRVFDSVPGELSRERLELAATIPNALDAGQFELWFQPKVDLSDGRISGAEGLVRWHHPTMGVLPPSRFLDVLELSADYHRFTRVMLTQAVEMIARCETIDRPIEVAVNLGSANFLDQGLPDHIRSLLRSHDVDPRRLTLEVTESELLDESGRDVPVFESLRTIGVGMSIDDFGTGYSSLHRLRALDIDEVKIDRSFTAGLTAGGEDEVIVRSVIRLGRLLGHRIVAEGIETPDQLELLRSYGCDLGQGFLFAPPQPTDDFVDQLWRRPYFPIDPRPIDDPSPSSGSAEIDAEPANGMLEVLDVYESGDPGPIDLLVECRRDPAVRRSLECIYERYERIDRRIGVIVKDLDGRLVDANAAFRQYFGDDYETFVGRSDADFLSDTNGSGHTAATNGTAADDVDHVFEIGPHRLTRVEHPELGTLLTTDGDSEWYHQVTTHPLVDARRRPAGQIQTVRPRRGISAPSD